MTKQKNAASAPRRILVAIGELAWYGAAAAILATAIYASEGREIRRNGSLSLPQLLVLYAAVTVCCGVLLGVLQPLARSAISIGVVSAVTAWPAALVVIWLANDRDLAKVSATEILISVGLAAVAGPLVAAYNHVRTQSKPDGA